MVDIEQEDHHAGQHEQERDIDPELWDERFDVVGAADRAEHHHRIDERRNEDAQRELVEPITSCSALSPANSRCTMSATRVDSDPSTP